MKLDADLADYFDSAEAVNKALRMVVQLAQIAKKPVSTKTEEKATDVATQDEEVTEEVEVVDTTSEAMFSEDDFEDEMPQSDDDGCEKKAE